MGNVSQKSNKPNRQSERTKSWIFDALMLLMDEKPYKKINISDITTKAGIARTTFYRNYHDKDDIVFEYLNKTITIKLQKSEKAAVDERKNTIVILLDYKHLIDHKKNLLKIFSNNHIENRIFMQLQRLPIEMMEHIKKQFSQEEYLKCRFKICYQINGSIRVITDWFVSNLPIPVEELIKMINITNNPRTPKYPDFPSIGAIERGIIVKRLFNIL